MCVLCICIQQYHCGVVQTFRFVEYAKTEMQGYSVDIVADVFILYVLNSCCSVDHLSRKDPQQVYKDVTDTD